MAECKDCRAERESEGLPKPPPYRLRKAEHPGPRCATHHRLAKRRANRRAHETRVRGVYGLGEGDYDRLLASQGEACAICRRATGRTRRLSVDHDHKTGYVRGLICRPCNNMLGHLRDSLDIAINIYNYLEAPPAFRVIGRVRPDDKP